MSRAADRIHKIDIIQTAWVIDNEGIGQKTVTVFKSPWASVEHRNSTEKWSDGRMKPDVTDLFTIGFVAGVTSAMGVTYGTKVYEILSVEDIRDEHRELIIQAKEVI